MGAIISSIQSAFQGGPSILLIGLGEAGKTMLVYRMQFGKIVLSQPTIGFNNEKIQHKDMTMYIRDSSGQNSAIRFWKFYGEGCSAIIFVVDSADNARFDKAREALHSILSSDHLRGAHLLVFANKQDVPGAASTDEIADRLEISNIEDRKVHLQACSIVNNTGVEEGFDWLYHVLKE